MKKITILNKAWILSLSSFSKRLEKLSILNLVNNPGSFNPNIEVNIVTANFVLENFALTSPKKTFTLELTQVIKRKSVGSVVKIIKTKKEIVLISNNSLEISVESIWDGRDNQGNIVEGGLFTIVIFGRVLESERVKEECFPLNSEIFVNNFSTVVQEGLVHKSAIGDEASEVVSGQEIEESKVNVDGTFTTKVSKFGTQLLFVCDDQKKLQGVTLSIGEDEKRRIEPRILCVDAEATALGLLFLVPGILTTDSFEAVQRIEELKSLTNFPSLVAMLEENLPNTSLTDLINQPELNTLLENVILEWIDQQTIKHRKLPSSEDGNFIEVSTKNLSDLSRVNLEVKNFAFRFVHMYQTEHDKFDNIISVRDLGRLGGAELLSWGDLFSFSFPFPPSIKRDNFVDYTVAKKARFWSIGTGFKNSGILLPIELDHGEPGFTNPKDLKTTAATIFVYVVSPLLDAILGLDLSQNELLKSLDEIEEFFQEVIQGNKIRAIFEAESIDELKKALVDFSLFVMEKILESNNARLLNIFKLTPESAAKALPILKVADGVISSVNLIAAAVSFFESSNVSVITVENRPPSADITEPSNGSVFSQGEEIVFLGVAKDADGFAIKGDDYIWSSNIDGFLGVGVFLVIDNLTKGDHRIILTVKDVHGASVVKSINIKIE